MTRLVVSSGPSSPQWLKDGWYKQFERHFPVKLVDQRHLHWTWLEEGDSRTKDRLGTPCSYASDVLKSVEDLSDGEYVLMGTDDFWLHSDYPPAVVESGPPQGADCGLTYRRYRSYRYEGPEVGNGWRRLVNRSNKWCVHFEFGFQRVGWLRKLFTPHPTWSPWCAAVHGTLECRASGVYPVNWQRTTNTFYNVLGSLAFETDAAGPPPGWVKRVLGYQPGSIV